MEIIKTWREQMREERKKREALHYQHVLLEDAACEQDEGMNQRLADIEDALCELDERSN